MRTTPTILVVTALTIAGTLDRALGKDMGRIGHFAKWATVEIAFEGPDSRGRGNPNPFGILVEVAFASPSGREWRVPGFYDGNGSGSLDGNVWKVRFSADEGGEWRFASRSRHARLAGHRGTFTVVAAPPDAKGFWKWGRLESVGTAANRVRYLKFRDGPYWLKAGCDDPENFLGAYRNYDTPAKRTAAVDYLARKGVNCLYIMTHNLEGDDKDVWCWLGKTPREAKANAGANARFDVARLARWRRLFEHMQTRGVVPYLVLEDDSAWKGYDHGRYYREMVARFGDLPALIFNFNEEYNENYRLPAALAHMAELQRIDPYDHPRGIHNVNSPHDAYVDAVQVDFTSIQTKSRDPLSHNRLAVAWIGRCLLRKRRVLMVGFDEGRPESDRRAWWSAYLGGGVWEAHVDAPYDRPMSAREPVWTQLGGARAFMESVPFWQMAPNNALVAAGKAFCLAKPGAAYALYLPDGGSVTVDLPPGGTYEYGWWKAANARDGRFRSGGRVGGGRRAFIAPGSGDWGLRILSVARP